MNPTTPSVEPARPAWMREAALAVAKQLYPRGHGEDRRYNRLRGSEYQKIVLEDQQRVADNILPTISSHAPAYLQSPAPAQPVTATRELVEALEKIAGWNVPTPYSGGPWKADAFDSCRDVARKALAAHEATRSLAAGQSGGVK